VKRNVRARATSVVVGVTFLLGVGVSVAPPSSAFTCIGITGWTATNSLGAGSTEFAKYNASHSDCRDFQAAYTLTTNDYLWGNYKGGDVVGSSWHEGSLGWQWVTTKNDGWDVLLTSVAAGTPMRGRGLSQGQNVRYVH
jgi:hypothetical protein